MSQRVYRTFQALVLASLGLYLFSNVVNGRVWLYINQRFVILVLLAAFGLLALAQVMLRERPAADSPAADQPARATAWGLWLLALPVLAGLLVPARPLGASALANRGINTGAGLAAQAGSIQDILAVPSIQRSALDWARIFQDGSPPVGEMADVVGFVFHDGRLPQDYFVVGRFSITCCVADAVGLGMVVEWPDAASLPDNRWVRVRGPVYTYRLDGRSLPLIEALQVETVPEPVQPYLFP